MNSIINSITDSIFNINDTNTTMLRNYCEIEGKIEQLTGKTLYMLERMFAAGWTLTPPENPVSLMEEMAKLAKEDESVV